MLILFASTESAEVILCPVSPYCVELPEDVVEKIAELDLELSEGDITQKGYEKKKNKLIAPFLKENQQGASSPSSNGNNSSKPAAVGESGVRNGIDSNKTEPVVLAASNHTNGASAAASSSFSTQPPTPAPASSSSSSQHQPPASSSSASAPPPSAPPTESLTTSGTSGLSDSSGNFTNF